MKKNALKYSAGIIICTALFFVVFKYFKKEPLTYTWNNIRIKPSEPTSEQKDLAASWDTVVVTREEVANRLPTTRQRLRLNSEMEQIAYDGDYYYNFLSTAMSILLDKMGKEIKIPPYINFEIDFEQWLKIKKRSRKDFSKDQITGVKSDFEYKFKQDYVRQILATKTPVTFFVFEQPPEDTIEWSVNGIASLGNLESKNQALFLCDMQSPICFEALDILKKISSAIDIKINYQPVSISQNPADLLKIYTGMCLTKIKPDYFWTYYTYLADKNEMQEDELYDFIGLDSDSLGQLKGCVHNPKTKSEFASYQATLNYLWKPILPVLVIQGELIVGPFSFDRVSEVVARRGQEREN